MHSGRVWEGGHAFGPNVMRALGMGRALAGPGGCRRFYAAETLPSLIFTLQASWQVGLPVALVTPASRYS